MTKFLHIADIHLGIKRYGLEERTKDFFKAWRTCLERYAVDEKVDFVLIAGDLFDRRQIDPQAANHAIIGLELLKNAGIPAFAIEGNHDQRETGSNFSWLRSFSQWRFLKLLEPIHRDGTVEYVPWNEELREGSFIDFKDVRIFGSRWYGVTTTNVIPQLQEAIRPNLREGACNLMMLHTEIEGQLNRPIPALSAGKLMALREGIDYLALGHIHKNFNIEGWAFNPGSLEAASIDEHKEIRGAYLVEIKNGKVQAELVRGYQQRPFRFLSFALSDYKDPEEALAGLKEYLLNKCRCEESASEEEKPIIELILNGRISFKSSQLKLDSAREETITKTGVLDVIFRNETIPVEYAVAADLAMNAPRSEREVRVLQDLVSQNIRWRENAPMLANMILEIKRLTLAGESPERLLDMIEQHTSRKQQEL